MYIVQLLHNLTNSWQNGVTISLIVCQISSETCDDNDSVFCCQGELSKDKKFVNY